MVIFIDTLPSSSKRGKKQIEESIETPPDIIVKVGPVYLTPPFLFDSWESQTVAKHVTKYFPIFFCLIACYLIHKNSGTLSFSTLQFVNNHSHLILFLILILFRIILIYQFQEE